MEFLNNLLENSSFPWLSAFVLGFMTAISPCPLATNITAIGYISKDITNKNKVFINGIIYTLGRSITYFLVALIIFIGLDQTKISFFFQKYGEKFIGPLLLFIGIIMLDIIKIKIPMITSIFNSKLEKKSSWGYIDVLLLGIFFAMAFCPYSAVLYFGMLIPMTITSPTGLYLPLLFAIATGLPVIIFAWMLAYAISNVGNFYNNLKSFELWFRRIIAVLFIGIGFFYIYKIYF